jgi:hypothetical protein
MHESVLAWGIALGAVGATNSNLAGKVIFGVDEMRKTNEKILVTTLFAAGVALTACGSSDNGSVNSGVSSGGSSGGKATAGAAAVSGTGVAGKSAPVAGIGASGVGAAGLVGVAGKTGTAGVPGDEDGGVSAGTGGTSGSSAGHAGSLAAGSGAAGGAAGKGASGAGGSSAGAATFTDVYKIIMTSCAGANCHVGATTPGDRLNMSDKATAYTNLVGVAAVSCAGQKRVVANDPTSSELVAALQHGKVGTCTAPKMPDNKPMLSQANIDTVVAWIKAGAMND